MREKFTYDSSSKVFKRKTLTTLQKILIVSLIIADTAISIGLVLAFSDLDSLPKPFLVAAVIAPTILTLIAVFYIGLHPKGPEKDFILPSAELDPDDCSTVKGAVRLLDGSLRDVEVLVPNVYGRSSLNLLEDGPSTGSSGEISTPEMFDMALETVRRKYSDCIWMGEPSI